MTRTIALTDETIDSRDVEERIAELTELVNDPNEGNQDLVDELDQWNSLRSQCVDYADDWEFGEQIIAEYHFQNFAQELAEDCGMVTNDDSWPNRCIDWELAAQELQQDYTSVVVDGHAFWVR